MTSEFRFATQTCDCHSVSSCNTRQHRAHAPRTITSTITGPRRSTCKQKKPRGPRLRVHRIVITRSRLRCGRLIGMPRVFGFDATVRKDKQIPLHTKAKLSIHSLAQLAVPRRTVKWERTTAISNETLQRIVLQRQAKWKKRSR